MPTREQQSNQPAPQNEIEEESQPEPAAVDDDMENIDPMLREAAVPDQEKKRQNYREKKNRERHERERLQRVKDGFEKEEESEGEEDQVSTEDIQILDLHSKRPIFSYRGRIFEGSWAENVGSEMILADHDEDSASTLPVLRNLAGDVDLLAASASRITTKEKTLNPKVRQENTLEPIRKEWNINIPKGAYKMSERARQGNFLEKLMALKIKKGDKDHVTVYAKRADGQEVDDSGDEPKKRGKSKARAGDQDGQGPPKRRRGSRGGRGRRGQPRGVGIPHERESEDAPEPLSVPTPQSWADLRHTGSTTRRVVTFQDQDQEVGDEDGSDDLESADEQDEEGDIENEDDGDEEDEDEEGDEDDGDSDDEDDDNDDDENEDISDDEMDEDDDEDESTPGIRSNTAMDID